MSYSHIVFNIIKSKKTQISTGTNYNKIYSCEGEYNYWHHYPKAIVRGDLTKIIIDKATTIRVALMNR